MVIATSVAPHYNLHSSNGILSGASMMLTPQLVAQLGTSNLVEA
jgi:hypothetical protein